jgi:hypothetical protein
MRQQTDPQKMSESEAFAKAVQRALFNICWLGVGAGVIALISNASWKLAVGMFVVYLIVYLFAVVIDALLVLMTMLLPSLLVSPFTIIYGRVLMGRLAWSFLTGVVGVIDAGAGLALGWYLYQRLF